MANITEGKNEPLFPNDPAVEPGRQFRQFRCLKCREKLFLLGKVAEPDGWALVRGGPDMHFEGNIAYMICPNCEAKNGFTEHPTTVGRGYHLTHIID